VVDCPHATPVYAQEKTPFPCIRTSDLQDGFLDWGSTKYVSESEYESRIKRLAPRERDVLYSREGERLGIAAIVPANIKPCLGQRMMLFRTSEDMATPEFLWGLLNSSAIYRQATRKVGGATSPHVNVGEIRRFEGFRPPLPLQEKYSMAYRSAAAMRDMRGNRAGSVESLWGNLLGRAFSGALTAAWREAHMTELLQEMEAQARYLAAPAEVTP
jgi:type I restriction enzyme, S subunit